MCVCVCVCTGLQPSAVVDSEAPGQLQRSLSQKRSSVASGPNDRSAVLHALTEQLSAENASLLAEIAKFHAGVCVCVCVCVCVLCMYVCVCFCMCHHVSVFACVRMCVQKVA